MSKQLYRRRVLRGVRLDRDAANLPTMSSQFLAGLHNSENDPRLVFGDLPYSVVITASLRSPAVRQAAALLERQYPDYWDDRR